MQFGPRKTSSEKPSAGKSRSAASSLGEPSLLSALSDRDFRRLGVSLNETRRTVIRRAADRSSRTLARRQLVNPSDKTATQLSQVATSAYRLLDPRQRESSKDRVYVGRIMPNALMWAGRTSFADGVGDRSAAEPNNDYVDDREYEEVIRVESLLETPATGMDLDAAWTRSLDSSDLIRPSARWVRWFRQQLHRPAVLLGLTALLLITTVWSWIRMSNERGLVSMRRVHPALETPDQTEAASSAVPTKTVSPSFTSAPDRLDATLASEGSGSPTQKDLVEPLSPSKVVAAEGTAPRNSVVPVATLDSAIAPESFPQVDGPQSVVKSDAKADLIDDIWNRAHVVETNDEMMALRIEEAFPMEFTVPADAPLVEQQRPEPTPIETPERITVKAAVPSEDEIRFARSQLFEVIPSLRESVDLEKIATLKEKLDRAAKASDPGSVDDWVVSAFQTQVAWLSGDTEALQKIVDTIQQRFDARADILLADGFVDAATLVLQSPTDLRLQEQLLRQGVRRADDLFVNEDWEATKKITRSLELLLEPLSAKNEFTQRVRNLREGLAKAERFAATVSLAKEASVNDAEPTEAALAGRYYCFLLRRWDHGLPWLAAGNDRRLAAIASDELALDGDLAATFDIAERWLAVAKRDDDRASVSMTLHAISLLQSCSTQQRGIVQLKTKRLLDQVLQDLPPDLKYLTDSVSLQSSAPSIADAPQIKTRHDVFAPEPSKTVANEMSGRIRINGKDVGLGLVYQPGVAITAESLQQISEILDQSVDTWSLDLVATFELETESMVSVRCGSASNLAKGRVWVDERRLEQFASKSTFVTPLPAGQHTVRWEIEGQSIDDAYLRIDDVVREKILSLRPAYQPKNDDLPTISTIKLLSTSP